MRKIDELLRSLGEKPDATDTACTRWAPVFDAAYRVGLALGIRLVANPSSESNTIANPDGAALDRDVAAALTQAVASASPEQKLTLLTLLETPGALSAAEGLISAVGGAR